MATAEYVLPVKCEVCGAEDLIVRVIFDKGITRCVCTECGWSRSLPKEENLKKRTNTSLNHWAARIVKNHPFCAICGSKEALEAHHIIPVKHSERYKYMDTNGIVLCSKCHWLAHNKEH